MPRSPAHAQAAPPPGDVDRKQKSLLAELDEIETQIGNMIDSAAQCLAEIGKDKPVVKQVESHAAEFNRLTTDVERRLLDQISYLSQIGVGSAHESSSYSSMRQRESAEKQLDYFHEKLERRSS